MNQKHIRFCDEYLIDQNGKQAAIRAGYAESRAEVTASELLARDDVQAYIAEKRQEKSKKLDVSFERVVQEYARLAFLDLRKIFTEDGALKKVADIDDDTAAALASIETYEEKAFDQVIGEVKKIKAHNKIAALDGLSKVLGYNAPEKHVNTNTNLGDSLSDDELNERIKKLQGK